MHRALYPAWLSLLAAGACGLGGCATIVQGEHEQIYFDSDPQGASVVANGERTVITPGYLNLERWRSHDITVSLPGYPSQSFTIESELSGWIWGNIIFGGIIGALIDWGTGAWGDLAPNGVFVDFYDSDYEFIDPDDQPVD
ncbi:MAG: translation initiation factor 2 [Planctomycetota bacterium]